MDWLHTNCVWSVKDCQEAVFLPTSIALCSALCLCTYIDVMGVDNTTGEPFSRFMSINPSADSAHFSVIYGRFRVLNVTKRLMRFLHSSSSTPTVTSIPASRSFFIPLPDTCEKGSMQPTTTRGMPLLMMRSAHGGVFP